MKTLLLEMKAVVERYKDVDKTKLSSYYREKFKAGYDAVLEKAKEEIVPSTTRKKSKAENLLARFEEYHVEITRFTENFEVPFDPKFSPIWTHTRFLVTPYKYWI